MVAPKAYYSTDASAPALTGTVGSLITLLDACLVNGYGSKAAAGWTKEFTGTNKAVYRMGAGGTADRMYLRIKDDYAGVAQRALGQGYRTMSDVDTGVKPFVPRTVFGNDDGVAIQKTDLDGASAKAWALFATSTAFYVFNEYQNAAALLGSLAAGNGNAYASGWFFGEYKKRFVGHTMNVALIGSHRNDQGATGSLYGRMFGKCINRGTNFGASFATTNNHWLARSVAGTDSPSVFGKTALTYWSNGGADNTDYWGFGASGPGLNPSIIDAKIRLSKIELAVSQPTYELIGEMPGLYNSLGQFWLPPNQVIAGVGTLAGNSYFVGEAGVDFAPGNSGRAGQMLVNLTDW